MNDMGIRHYLISIPVEGDITFTDIEGQGLTEQELTEAVKGPFIRTWYPLFDHLAIWANEDLQGVTGTLNNRASKFLRYDVHGPVAITGKPRHPNCIPGVHPTMASWVIVQIARQAMGLTEEEALNGLMRQVRW